MAGMLYLRLFVYHCEAEKKGSTQSKTFKERRLTRGIINPVMIPANIDERAVRHRAARRALCGGNCRSNSASKVVQPVRHSRMLGPRQNRVSTRRSRGIAGGF